MWSSSVKNWAYNSSEGAMGAQQEWMWSQVLPHLLRPETSCGEKT